MNTRPTLILLLLSATIFLSCEKKNNGLVDPSLTSPFVHSISLTYQTIDLDDTAAVGVSRLPNGEFLIKDSLIALANDPDGQQDIKKVFYRIYAPGELNYFASGSLTRVQTLSKLSNTLDVTFSGLVSFRLTRNDVGVSRIEVIAQDQVGLNSNSAQVSLSISRANSIPQYSSIVVPDTVTLPPGDSLLIKMTASVNDSDGLGDIREVFFYSLNSADPTRKFFLLDDGNGNGLSGDALSGDGIYTITVKLRDQGNVRRTYFFEFNIVDKQGAEAETVVKSLTVQ